MTHLIDADQLVRNNPTIRQSRIEGRVWILAVAILQLLLIGAGLLQWISPAGAASAALAVGSGWIFVFVAAQRSRRLEVALRNQIEIRNARVERGGDHRHP